jgi:hypothetical protein
VRGCCRGPGYRASEGEVGEFLGESSEISSSKLCSASYFGKGG